MSAVWVLLRKELTEALRDRRTLALMLLIPVLLYPGMLVLIGGVMAAGKERLAKEPLEVAVLGDETLAFLGAAPAFTSWKVSALEPALAGLREKTVGAVVELTPGARARIAEGGQVVATVRYTKRHDRSIEAMERVRKVLEKLAGGALEVRLTEAKLPKEFGEPVRVAFEDVDFQQDLGPLVASRLLPVILVLMLFMGALYPAIEMTAGEKERGTWETVLVAPVRPVEVMASKYLAVATLSSLTALANLLAMSLTFGLGVKLEGGAAARMQLEPGQVLVLLAALVPAAAMVSGVALTVASVAKDHKEAQALMTPFTLIGSLPGMLALMPGVELTPLTAMVPLLNVALLVKAEVLGAATPVPVAITCASTVVFCGLALWLVAKAARSEVVRFGGASLLGLLRGDRA